MGSSKKRPHDSRQHPPASDPKKIKTHHQPKQNRDHVRYAHSGPPHEVSKPDPEVVHISRPTTRQSPSSPAPPPSTTTGSIPALPPIPPDIEKVVFTHPEALDGPSIGKIDSSYDRLEFLGDAYIELMASRLVLKLFPQMPTGRLSQQREMLVKNDTLAEYAKIYGFPSRIIIPSETLSSIQTKSKPANHHHSSGPTAYTKLLADVFEAYIAAIVTSSPSPSPATASSSPNDEAFHTAESFLHTLWSRKLSLRPEHESQMMDPDAKLKLACRLLSRGIRLDYRETRPRQEVRNEGKCWFFVGVHLQGWGHADAQLGSGKGLNKQEAGQKAAEDAMRNPLVAELEAVKRASDERNQREREGRERDKGELERAEDAVELARREVEAARERMAKAEGNVKKVLLRAKKGREEAPE